MAKIVKIEGLSELQAKFEEMNVSFQPKVRSIVAKHGAQLKTRTAENMSNAYTAGYSTGATRRSLTTTFSDGGMTVAVAPHTEYFPYLEYGTRFMSARPTLKPAFAFQSVQFVNELKKMMK